MTIILCLDHILLLAILTFPCMHSNTIGIGYNEKITVQLSQTAKNTILRPVNQQEQNMASSI